MSERIDIIIPTCKIRCDIEPLVAEIKATAGQPVNVIATCQPVCAARNRNIGLEEATSELRIMVDDDITGLLDGWVAALIQPLLECPECVMVSPRLMRPDGRYAFMMGCEDSRPIGAGLSPVKGPHLLTACVAIRKDDLRFDENFIGSGWEDNEYCDQQNRRYPGYTRMIQHNLQVVHKNEQKNQGRHFSANRAYYVSKGGEP